MVEQIPNSFTTKKKIWLSWPEVAEEATGWIATETFHNNGTIEADETLVKTDEVYKGATRYLFKSDPSNHGAEFILLDINNLIEQDAIIVGELKWHTQLPTTKLRKPSRKTSTLGERLPSSSQAECSHSARILHT